jgi:O-antigen/teichoic acid export membrane protein
LIKSILKDTSKDAFRYVPAKVVPAMVNFVGLIVFTHIFSPEDYGNYFIILTTITVLHLIGSNWASSSVMRFYAEFNLKGNLNELFTNIIFSFLICNAIVAIIYLSGLVIFKTEIPSQLVPFLKISIFCYLFGAAYLVLLYSLRAGLQAAAFSKFEIISSVGKFALAIALAFLLKMGSISLLWGMLCMNLILVALISRKLSLFEKLKKSLFSLKVSLNFFKYGAPLALSGLSAWLLILSDRYLLQYFGTAKDVGIYSVSFSVVDGSFVLLYSILMLAAYPVIVLTWEEKGREITQQLIREFTRYYFILCIPIFVGISILSKDIFSLFVGKSFSESYKLVPLFAFCSLAQGLFQYISTHFELYKKTLILALILLAAGVVNIFLNILFIPSFGYMGAGIAKIIANVILLILGISVSHVFLPWLVPLRSIVKVAFSATMMGVILAFLGRILATSIMNLIILVVIGTCIYFLILLIIHEIKQDEVDFVKSHCHRLIKAVIH